VNIGLAAVILGVVILAPAAAIGEPNPMGEQNGISETAQGTTRKARILVHVTHGPEQPTRAGLAFLVAKSALNEGHIVTLFLAGDAVQLIRDPVLDNLVGLGTGRLRDLYDAIVARGARFYLSRMSSSARGVTEADLKGKPAQFAQPRVFVRLSLEHDRMFTY
jgi:predicted peroxiredoxin